MNKRKHAISRQANQRSHRKGPQTTWPRNLNEKEGEDQGVRRKNTPGLKWGAEKCGGRGKRCRPGERRGRGIPGIYLVKGRKEPISRLKEGNEEILSDTRTTSPKKEERGPTGRKEIQ